MEKKYKKNVSYSVVEDHGTEGTAQYGINVSNNGETVDEVKDITVDREKAFELVRLFNELELATVHFRDVLEDFLP